MREDWIEIELKDACGIHDNLRKPINSSERNKRIQGKQKSELYPYYGATGQVGYIDDYLTDGEYVLIGEDGAPFLDYTKNVAYLINGKTWVNNHAHILRSYFNNRFLLYYLNTVNFNGFVSGTTRLKLTQASLKKIPIKLAPLSEQRAIVAKIEQLFSELDNGIANLKAAKDKLEIYRQAVLKKAFEGEFEIKKIKEVCENIKVGIVIKPTQYYSIEEDGVPAFRSANVREFKIENANWVYFTKDGNRQNSRTQIKENDVLIVRSGYPGTSCVVPKKYEGSNAIDILIATPDQRQIHAKYLCAFNNSPLGKGLFRAGSRGVAQQHLNVGIYSNLNIPVPSIEQQSDILQEIETRLSVCDNILTNIEEGLEKTEALRQSILKQAFEGKLLNETELQACRKESDWEPAEKLLSRIKLEKEKL